jgi:hypothetical protein
MQLNIPRRKADPNHSVDECLFLAFGPVLTEGLPARFAVLLDALSRQGSDHDPDDQRSAR